MLMLMRVGDVIAVPAGDAERECQVLYVSTYFRDVVLLGVLPAVQGERYELLIYTAALASVRAGDWKIVGTKEPFEPELLSTRIVATDVWRGDEKLRPANSSDRTLLPTMRVAGQGAVEKMLQSLTANDQSKMLMLALGETARLLEGVERGAVA